MKNNHIVVLIFLLFQISCVPEKEITMSINGTLSALPTITNNPTYTYSPTYTQLSSTQEIPKPNPSPTPQILVNGWYRFVYLEAGYSIDYPSDATLSLSADVGLDYSTATINFPKIVSEGYQGMQIFAYLNKDYKSLDENADDLLLNIFHGKLPEDIRANKKTTHIAGHYAITIETFQNIQIVFIESRGKFYLLSLGPNMMSGNPPTNESVELFHMILTTISIF